jgi:ABC-type Fe3+-hydroxamate transport system substrate-binding protein
MAPPAGRFVVDDLARPMALGRAVRRIVSIAPSCTESLLAIGAGARLVGVEEHSRSEALAGRAGEEDPACRSCGGILKTATVSFGQSLVAADLARAEQAARRSDLLLAVGTTLSVWPIAGVVPLAKEAGARVVIVNAEPTDMDTLGEAVLRGPISELLPAVVGAADRPARNVSE